METGVTKLKQTYTHIHIHVIFTKQYIHTHRIRKRKTNRITRKCQHFPLEVAWDNLFTLASASVISDFNISAPLISDFYSNVMLSCLDLWSQITSLNLKLLVLLIKNVKQRIPIWLLNKMYTHVQKLLIFIILGC